MVHYLIWKHFSLCKKCLPLYYFSEKMSTNPWRVDSIQEFYFLKCPECIFMHKEENYFQNHAINNHPLSVAFFGESVMKKEEIGDLEDFDELCKKGNTELNTVIKKERIEIENDVDLDCIDSFRTMENVQKTSELIFPIKNVVKLEEKELEMLEISQFTNASELNNLEGPKLFNCSRCHASFQNKHDLKLHNFSVHEGEKLFRGPICGNSFDNNAHLKNRIAIVADKVLKPFKCTICEDGFTLREKLKRHIVEVHEGLKPFKCSLCEQVSFARKETLKQHFVTVHKVHNVTDLIPVNNKKKKYKCSDCDESFTMNYNLNQHIRSAHNGRKEFWCSFCEEKFTMKQLLKRHYAKVHDGQIPYSRTNNYKCSNCNACFTKKHYLDQHIVTVHDGTKYKCSNCDEYFAQKQGLNQHIASVHDGTKYKCLNCDASFTKKQNLKNHLDTVHEGLKPFKCSICDVSFTQIGSMNKHIKCVHEGQKFNCSICNASFTRGGNLKKHIARVHERDKPNASVETEQID